MLTRTINNKEVEFRNLEEQVQKNKEDIAAHYEIDRVIAEFGLKFLGLIPNVQTLPDPLSYTGNYGDTYAVGTEDMSPEDYVYYVYSRANIYIGKTEPYWFKLGRINLVGPEGPKGDKGDKGERGESGATWYTSSVTLIPDSTKYKKGDLYLNTTTGSVFRFDIYAQPSGSNLYAWTHISNIIGPQGLEGRQGKIGPQGIQGFQGIPGRDGKPGQAFTIVGTLLSESALPTPTPEIINQAYLIKTDDINYLYAIIPNEENILVWQNLGNIAGIKGETGQQGIAGNTPSFDIRNTNELYVSYDNGVTYNYLFTFTPESTTPITSSYVANLMETSETIIPDLDMESEKIQFHLDNDLLNNINRSVKIPLSNTTNRIFAVDSEGNQTMLVTGNDIRINGIVLEKIPKYMHNINVKPNPEVLMGALSTPNTIYPNFQITLITDSITAYTDFSFFDYMEGRGQIISGDTGLALNFLYNYQQAILKRLLSHYTNTLDVEIAIMAGTTPRYYTGMVDLAYCSVTDFVTQI